MTEEENRGKKVHDVIKWIASIILGGISGGVIGFFIVFVYWAIVEFYNLCGGWFCTNQLITSLVIILASILIGGLIGANADYLYHKLRLRKRGYGMKKIALLPVIIVVVMSGVGYAVYSTIPELQDFPGLQQEFDNLEGNSDLGRIYFEGDPGNKITIEGYVGRGANIFASCNLLTDSVEMYMSDHYHLTVKVMEAVGTLDCWACSIPHTCN